MNMESLCCLPASGGSEAEGANRPPAPQAIKDKTIKSFPAFPTCDTR